jgi:hypothetical protein
MLLGDAFAESRFVRQAFGQFRIVWGQVLIVAGIDAALAAPGSFVAERQGCETGCPMAGLWLER